MIAIKQFLCCATAFHYKSLVNEVLSAFFFFLFFQVAVIIIYFLGLWSDKKVETFWTMVNISIS